MSGTPTRLPAEDEPAVDRLADTHAVVRGQTRVRTKVVLRGLAERNPDEYEDWSSQDLAEAFDGATRQNLFQSSPRPKTVLTQRAELC